MLFFPRGQIKGVLFTKGFQFMAELQKVVYLQSYETYFMLEGMLKVFYEKKTHRRPFLYRRIETRLFSIGDLQNVFHLQKSTLWSSIHKSSVEGPQRQNFCEKSPIFERIVKIVFSVCKTCLKFSIYRRSVEGISPV